MGEIHQSDMRDMEEVTINVCDNEILAGPDHAFERYDEEQVIDEEDQLLGEPQTREQYVIKISGRSADGVTKEFTVRGPACIKQQVVDSVMELLKKGCTSQEIATQAECSAKKIATPEPDWEDEYEASIDL